MSGGDDVISVTSTSCALAFTIVGLRLYTRIHLLKRLGTEDYLALTALAMLPVPIVNDSAKYSHRYVLWLISCAPAFVPYGIGVHMEDVSKEDFMQILKIAYVNIIFFNGCLNFSKLSIVTQYLVVFQDGKTRICCWIVLAMLVFLTLWNLFSELFFCTPIHHYWDIDSPGSCLDRKVIWDFNAGVHIATSVALFIVPIPKVVGLNLPKAQKIAVVVLFSLGLTDISLSILRVVQLHHLFVTTDITWQYQWIIINCALEMNLALICATLPVLRPFVLLIVSAFKRNVPYKTTFTSRRPWRSGRSKSTNDVPDTHTSKSESGRPQQFSEKFEESEAGTFSGDDRTMSEPGYRYPEDYDEILFDRSEAAEALVVPTGLVLPQRLYLNR